MKPDGVTDPPGTDAVMEAYGWKTQRQLDEVRAAALHEACVLAERLQAPMVDQILVYAERFERWLTGTDEDSP